MHEEEPIVARPRGSIRPYLALAAAFIIGGSLAIGADQADGSISAFPPPVTTPLPDFPAGCYEYLESKYSGDAPPDQHIEIRQPDGKRSRWIAHPMRNLEVVCSETKRRPVTYTFIVRMCLQGKNKGKLENYIRTAQSTAALEVPESESFRSRLYARPSKRCRAPVHSLGAPWLTK